MAVNDRLGADAVARAKRLATVHAIVTGLSHGIVLLVGFALHDRGLVAGPHEVVFTWIALWLGWNAAQLWNTRDTGEALLVELPQARSRSRVPATILGLLPLGLGILFAVDDGRAGLLEGGLIALGVVALSMTWFVRPARVGIATDGVRVEHHFVPWDRVVAIEIDGSNRLHVFDRALAGLAAREYGPFDVPPACRPEVERALAVYVADRALGLVLGRP